MPTTVGILTFMSGKNSILGLSEPKTSWISWHFYPYEHLKFHAQLSWAWKKFYNLGASAFFNMPQTSSHRIGRRSPEILFASSSCQFLGSTTTTGAEGHTSMSYCETWITPVVKINKILSQTIWAEYETNSEYLLIAWIRFNCSIRKS